MHVMCCIVVPSCAVVLCSTS